MSITPTQRYNHLISNSINALRYTNPPRGIDIRVSTTDKNCVIDISDNGPGVQPSMLPNLWQLYATSENKAPASVFGCHSKSPNQMAATLKRVITKALGLGFASPCPLSFKGLETSPPSSVKQTTHQNKKYSHLV